MWIAKNAHCRSGFFSKGEWASASRPGQDQLQLRAHQWDQVKIKIKVEPSFEFKSSLYFYANHRVWQGILRTLCYSPELNYMFNLCDFVAGTRPTIRASTWLAGSRIWDNSMSSHRAATGNDIIVNTYYVLCIVGFVVYVTQWLNDHFFFSFFESL